jgi:hypothetical protein
LERQRAEEITAKPGCARRTAGRLSPKRLLHWGGALIIAA